MRTFRTLERRSDPPGIKPKAPGKRLPVPAGWRFVSLARRSEVVRTWLG